MPRREAQAAGQRLQRHARLHLGRLGRQQVAVGCEAAQVQSFARVIEQGAQGRFVSVHRHGREKCQAGRPGAAPRGREYVHHRTAAQRLPRRRIAHDEAVAAQCGHGRVQHQLRPAARARIDGLGTEHGHAAGHVRGADVHVHGRPVGQRLGEVTQCVQPHVQPRPRRGQLAAGHPVPALDPRAVQLGTGEVERTALPGQFSGDPRRASTSFLPGGAS